MEKSKSFFENVKASIQRHVRLSIQHVRDERRRRAESIQFSSLERQNLGSRSVGILIPIDDRVGQSKEIEQVFGGQNIIFKGPERLELATDPRKLNEAVAQIRIDGESARIQIGDENTEIFDGDSLHIGENHFRIRLLGGNLQTAMTGAAFALMVSMVTGLASPVARAEEAVASGAVQDASLSSMRILDKKVLFDLGKGVDLNVEIDSIQRVDTEAFSVSIEESGEVKSLYVSKVILAGSHTIFSVDNTGLCAHKNMASKIEAAMRQIVNQGSDDSIFSLLTTSSSTAGFVGRKKEDVDRADLVLNCQGTDKAQNPFDKVDTALTELMAKAKSGQTVRFIPISGTTVSISDHTLANLQALDAKVFPLSFSPLHLGMVDDTVAQMRGKIQSARAKLIEDDEQSSKVYLPQSVTLHISSPFLLGLPKSLRMLMKVTYTPTSGTSMQASVDAQPFVDSAFKERAAKILVGLTVVAVLSVILFFVWLFLRFKPKKCPVTGEVISRQWRTNLWVLENEASVHVEDTNGRHILTCALDKPSTEIGRRVRGVTLPHVPKDFSPLEIRKRPGGVYTLENKSPRSKMRIGDLVLEDFLVLAHNQVFTLGSYRVRFWAPTAK